MQENVAAKAGLAKVSLVVQQVWHPLVGIGAVIHVGGPLQCTGETQVVQPGFNVHGVAYTAQTKLRKLLLCVAHAGEHR